MTATYTPNYVYSAPTTSGYVYTPPYTSDNCMHNPHTGLHCDHNKTCCWCGRTRHNDHGPYAAGKLAVSWTTAQKTSPLQYLTNNDVTLTTTDNGENDATYGGRLT